MSSKYKPGYDDIPHFITSTVIGWVDALSRPLYKDIIIESLQFCIDKKGLHLHAWVIMNNHIHFIISADTSGSISEIVRDFKKYTSRQIIEAIEDNPQESRKKWMLGMFGYAGKHNSSNENYQFWQQDYHPVELNTKEKWDQRLKYLHDNPVRAGIVWEAQQYKYSSAIDYYETRQGLLPLNKLL